MFLCVYQPFRPLAILNRYPYHMRDRRNVEYFPQGSGQERSAMENGTVA